MLGFPAGPERKGMNYYGDGNRYRGRTSRDSSVPSFEIIDLGVGCALFNLDMPDRMIGLYVDNAKDVDMTAIELQAIGIKPNAESEALT